ncbi:hypothetical protein TWF481_003390 [Arthrobotrys musiformis]|uniref:Uncharacterized protein n=1 Tax=Arthrobotrys musiformis TaxID=47236 RepID=A0AAV9VSN3_9PEZI
MGYTHYYHGQISRTTSSALQTDIQTLLTTITTTPTLSATIKITGPSGTGPPGLTDPTSISLNAEADGGHEPLIIPMGEYIPFRFCKTARKPYDAVVGAVLLRCLFYSPPSGVADGTTAEGVGGKGFVVQSDGSWEEWMPARELYLKAFGVEPTMPEGMTPSWN